MQTENKIFEDFTKFVNGAAGTLAGMGREAETAMRERAKEWIGGADFVSREEFEALKAIALEARAEIDRLRAEIAGAKGNAAPAGDAPPATAG
jgi:BMFP domain-containing protein YqiC